MSVSNFEFPVTGVTGPTFRDNLSEAILALASNHRSDGELPVVYPGMTRVLEGTEGSSDVFQVRGSSSWVTLFPNLSEEYGGLRDILGAGGLLLSNNTFTGSNTFTNDSIFKTTATFDSTVLFKGNVTFQNNPGFATESFVNDRANVIATNIVDNAIDALNDFGSVEREIDADPNLNTVYSYRHNFDQLPRVANVYLRLQQAVAGYPDNALLPIEGVTGITLEVNREFIQVVLGRNLVITEKGSRTNFTISSSDLFALKLVLVK